MNTNRRKNQLNHYVFAIFAVSLIVACSTEPPSAQSNCALVGSVKGTIERHCFQVINGRGFVEGDIDLGSVNEIHQRTKQLSSLANTNRTAIAINGVSNRWLNGVIPYTVDSSLREQESYLNAAFSVYAARTGVKFVKRTTEKDYVTFRYGNDGKFCSSNIGRIGGQQYITCYSLAETPTIVHELGHTLGFWHEQTRSDRDSYVTIHWDKISPEFTSEFTSRKTQGSDIGPYNFDSIMHYPPNSFSTSAQSYSITKLDGSIIGLSGAYRFAGTDSIIYSLRYLNNLDVDAINQLYPIAQVYSDPNERFIRRLYYQVLRRSADDPSVAYWKQQLTNGLSRASLARFFLQSPERTRLVQPYATPQTNYERERMVTVLYQEYLNRRPDSGGLNYWAGLVKSGVSLLEVAVSLLASAEAFNQPYYQNR